MSFNFEFTAASSELAEKILTEEHAPDCVKAFIAQAVKAVKPPDMVYVKAVGHLFNDDYQTSTYNITVCKAAAVRYPKSDKNDAPQS